MTDASDKPYSPECAEDDFCELRFNGVLRSSYHVTSHGCSLPPTLPFDAYPHHVVLTLPSVAETQVLHDGLVSVPYPIAVIPIERQEAQELFVRPPLD